MSPTLETSCMCHVDVYNQSLRNGALESILCQSRLNLVTLQELNFSGIGLGDAKAQNADKYQVCVLGILSIHFHLINQTFRGNHMSIICYITEKIQYK